MPERHTITAAGGFPAVHDDARSANHWRISDIKHEPAVPLAVDITANGTR
jgi:hypothetical protein